MKINASLFALLPGVVSAFTTTPLAATTAGRSSSSNTILQAFEEEIGVTAPLGFWDPLGLLKDADQERFNRLRYVELKHARISMLAIVGHLTTGAGVRLGGDIDLQGTSFSDVPAGLAALSKIAPAGLAQIVAFVGFLELAVMKDVTGDGEFIGDFRNDAIDFGWDVFSPEEQERKRTIELNQGRAAMMGILALMVHEQLDNNPYMINGLIGHPVDFNAGF
mmetsp:Transcript_81/g.354  ORF Transcript_81/g.354 Transcript_81/m.354 type:complete len:221 (+) Transcript_81:232-894(+)|eukprot:CAMPEP_0168737208 /NCGR_PEP_ID=MMETSP0724-20121128/10269_1 /TAXON_ID=265536 /ORGANISM="Amphiprora sp., Strain CCMP467" /LENGTH=220 /DNA_ID=CAMNT_0008784453 /DNA_START=137 /DNA_END=799 /DNA_ORIENTATION=-